MREVGHRSPCPRSQPHLCVMCRKNSTPQKVPPLDLSNRIFEICNWTCAGSDGSSEFHCGHFMHKGRHDCIWCSRAQSNSSTRTLTIRSRRSYFHRCAWDKQILHLNMQAPRPPVPPLPPPQQQQTVWVHHCSNAPSHLVGRCHHNDDMHKICVHQTIFIHVSVSRRNS